MREQRDTGQPGAGAPSRAVANSVYSLLTYVLYLPLALLASRIILHHIGSDNFGVWSTLTTFTGFGFVLDFGISVPLVKYVSEFVALGRTRDVNILVATALTCYGAVSALFTGTMMLCRDMILSHTLHSHAGDPALRTLYAALLVGFAWLLMAAALRGLLLGLQRADVVARIAFLSNLVAAVGNVVAVLLGWGVTGLGLSWLLMVVVNVCMTWTAARRYFPGLRCNPLHFRWHMLRLILGYSVKVQVNFALETLNDQVDRTLIGIGLGPALVGQYALAQQPSRALRGISSALTSSMLPAASELFALGRQSELEDLFIRSIRHVALAVLPVCGCGIVLAQPLVALWLGRGYATTGETVAIIWLGYCIWLPAQAATSVLNGMSRADIVLRADVALLALHVPLCVLLLWRFGYPGTIAGTSLTIAGTRLYILVRGSRALCISPSTLFKGSFLHPLTGTLVALLPVLGWHILRVGAGPLQTGVQLALFGITYLSYAAAFGVDTRDRAMVRAIAGKLTVGLKGVSPSGAPPRSTPAYEYASTLE